MAYNTYVISALFIVKIIQVISLVICSAMVASFNVQVMIENSSYNTLQFFILVTLVACITCIIILLLNLTRVTQNLLIPWHCVNLIFGVLFSLFILLASALLSNTLTDMQQRTGTYGRNSKIDTQCSYIDRTKSKTSCAVLEPSMIFGYLRVDSAMKIEIFKFI